MLFIEIDRRVKGLFWSLNSFELQISICETQSLWLESA